MKIKQVIMSSILLVVFVTSGFAQRADSAIVLANLVQEAIKNNPDLQSAYNSWQASEAQVPQAGALPDPTVSFNLMNLPVNTFDFNQEPMTGKQIAVMQMFPFPGKLGLRENIAREGAGAAQQKYRELQNQLVKNVKRAYYDLFFVDKAIEIIRDNQSALQEFVRIAQTKYSVGRGLQQDVLKAQVELSKMMDKLITMQQKRETIEARLNALLNRVADTPVGQPQELRFESFDHRAEELKSISEQNRPLFKAWQAIVRQSEQKVKLARKDYFPNFALGVAYNQREVLKSGMGGVDFLSGMLSVNIPLYFWKKQSKKVEEMKYNEISVCDRYRNVQNQVFASLDETWNDLNKNSRLVNLFDTGIIPQATQSLQSAISGYQNDSVDFLTMVNNQITLFNYQMDYYRVLSDYYKNIADMESIVGVEF